MTVLDRPETFTTLPREYYLDEQLFEAEVRRIWYHQWLYLVHESEIPRPGDFVTRRILGENVLVIRTRTGAVRAMLNVCRHRGARIVDQDCGRLRNLVCPYHQWTYDLEGRLKGAPSMRDGNGIDYDLLDLYGVPLEIWHGFVFGCLGEEAPKPLAPQIARLAPALGEYRPERLRKVVSRSYECEGNWKVMLENYLECYHCAGSHPEFCVTADLGVRASEDYAAQSWTDDPYWGTDVELKAGTESVSVTGQRICRVPLYGDGDLVAGRTRSFGDWAGASVLYFYPDHAMTHAIQPISATRTRFELTWFVDQDATADDYAVDDLVHVWEATTLQDIALIERSQAGLTSRRYVPGPLSARHEPYIRSSLATYRSLMHRN